ncbi:MAG: ribose-phosphate pyrophosphokinase-like domain-containing protein, partial [Desulfovibrionaceae bacterium]|nr:ribose-phosphate pyrophosphokinase-like domain-containing protein [Desulfovibrionaceae bacterium]
MPNKIKIISGTSNPALAEAICAKLRTKPTKVLLDTFNDGESRVEIQESVRGEDIYVMQSTCSPVNDNL